jgi:Flp pilus assembly protein TadG
MNIVRRARRDEQGLSLVLVALLMVAMLTIAAIALDGGQTYSDRRQMQNASDAAALAGTRALEVARFRGGSTAAVDTTASSEASNNGADISVAGGHYVCTVIDKNNNDIAACSNTAVWAAAANVVNAGGVRVKAGRNRITSFATVIGIGSLSVNTTAAATIQVLTGADSPFMVCGNPLKGAESPPLLVADATQPTGWQVNSAAIGSTYNLHGPQISNCGAGSNSFKGLASGPVSLPQWVDAVTGVRAGPTRSLVAGINGCSGTNLDECILLVPICSDGRGQGSSTQLYCVGWGSFLVHQTGANKHTGDFRGAADAIGGPTGTGDPNAGTVNVVKLIQ